MAKQLFKSFLLLSGGESRAQVFASASRDVFLLPFNQPRIMVYDRTLDPYAPREILKPFETWQECFDRFFGLLQPGGIRLTHVEPRFAPHASRQVQSDTILLLSRLIRQADAAITFASLRGRRDYDVSAVEFQMLGMDVRYDADGRIEMRGSRVRAREALESQALQTLLGLA